MKRGDGSGEDAIDRRLDELADRFELDDAARRQLAALVAGLAAEADPPTTVREPAEVVDRHLADSLVAVELDAVRATRRGVDIGSGAGFPGIPLAIALPEARFDLLEASRRKCQLIERLIAACGAANASAVAERAETWGAGEGRGAYDLVGARAVAPLAVLTEYAAPLLRVGGALVAWKGRREPGEERSAASAAARLGLAAGEVRAVTPFAGARDRHLHVFLKREPTPPGFPRRPGRAAKRPLA